MALALKGVALALALRVVALALALKGLALALALEGLALALIFQSHVKSGIISLIIKMVAKSQRLSTTNISAIQSIVSSTILCSARLVSGY